MAKGDLTLKVGAETDVAALNGVLGDIESLSRDAQRALNKELGGKAEKKLIIRTETDDSGFKKLVALQKESLSVFDQIANKSKQNDRIQAGSITSLRQQFNTAKQTRDELAKFAPALNAYGSKVRTINPLWAEQNQKVARIKRELDLAGASTFWEKAKTGLRVGGLIDFANGLTQITTGLQSASIVIGQFSSTINTLVRSLAKLQAFSLSFEGAGAGLTGGTFALQESSRIALDLGVNLGIVRDGFQQLTPVVLNIGGTINDVSNIVEALSSRFTVFGLDADKARRIMNGVIQAFAKGKLQAEELTQQISEADPAFKTDLAAAIGVTVAELERLVQAGEITAEVLKDVLPELSKASILFGKLGFTAVDAVDALGRSEVKIDQVRSKLQALTQLNLETLSESLRPLVNAFLRINATVVDFTTNIQKLSVVKALTTLLAGTATAIGRVLETLLRLAEAALVVIEPIAKFVDTLLRIPGAAEAAGFLLLGKLLGGLGKIKQGFLESEFAASGFGKVIARGISFEGVGKGVNKSLQGLGLFRGGLTEVEKQFLGTKKLLSRPIAVAPIKGLDANIQQIFKASSGAVNQVSAVADKASRVVSQKIDKTVAKIGKIEQELAKLPATKISIAPAFRQATKEVAATTAAVAGASQQFDQANAFLDRYEAGLTTFTKTNAAAKAQVASLALAIRDIGDTKVELITPEFIQRTKQLAATNPARAIFLLEAALEGVTKQAAKFDPSSLIGKELEASAKLGRDALQGITASAGNAAAEQQKVQQQVSETTSQVAGLRAELGKPSSGQLTEAEIDRQRKLQEELDKSKRKLRALYAQQAQRVARQEATGGVIAQADPSKLTNANALIDQNTREVRKNLAEKLTASNKTIQALDREEQALKQVLDTQRSQRKGITDVDLPAPFLKGRFEEQKEIDATKARLAEIKVQREAEIAAIGKQAAAETDLASVQAAATRAGRGSIEQAKALKLQRDLLVNQKGKVTGALEAEKKKLEELRATQARLRKEQAARPFTGVGSQPQAAFDLKAGSQEIKATEANVRALQGQLNVLNGGLGQTREAYANTTRAASAFGGKAPALVNAKLAISSAAKNTAKAAGGLAKGLAGSAAKGAGALLSALGPLTIALGVVAAAQAAYSSATKESRAAQERAAAASKAYADLLQEITQEEPPPPKLTGFALAWETTGLNIADAVDGINAKYQELIAGAEKLAKDGKSAADSFGNNPFAQFVGKQLEKVAAIADGTATQIRSFGRTFNVTVSSIESQADDIDKVTDALIELAAESDGTAAAQAKLSGKFTTGIALIGATAEELSQAQERLKNFQDTLGDDIPPGLQKKLDELSEAVKKAEERFLKARNRFTEAGDQLNLTAEAIRNATNSTEALNARVKTLEESLSKLDPASDQFGKLAVRIAATRQALDKAGRSANDPRSLLKALPRATDDARQAVSKLADELAKVEGREINTVNDMLKQKAEIDALKVKIAEAAKELEELSALEARLKVLIQVEDAEFRATIEKLERDSMLTKIQLAIGIDQPALAGALTEISNIAGGIQDLLSQQSTIRIKLSDPGLGESERSALLKEQAVTAKQIENATETAVANLQASASRLRTDLQAATRNLENLILSLRSQKIGKFEFLTPAERTKVIQDTAREFEALTKQLGFRPRIEGDTIEEITAQKQAFIEFRRGLENTKEQIDEARNKIGDITQALGATEAALDALVESGVEGLFESIAEAVNSLPEPAFQTTSSFGEAATSLDEGSSSSAQIADNLRDASTEANQIVDAFKGLDGFQANIQVKGVQGLWTGGPATAGQTYQVNELGQEGFLSATGKLSAINKPKNALWKAPSSGTVIPAHIWSQMDVPRGGVQVSARPAASMSNQGSVRDLVQGIQLSLAANQNNDELANVQAQQALEIGKLGRAVEKLTSKKWNVQVGVTNTGNSAYLNAINHRL